jgi:SAM-dependent MidA family methyltransferase
MNSGAWREPDGARRMSLRQRIAEEIRQHGPMRFSRYMELCLYEPELGYYSRAAEKFGKAGDFYTASDVHAVYGRLLARQFEEIWTVLGAPRPLDIIELGPGRGLFAQDVLDWSKKKWPDLLEATRYTLVESSPALRWRLEQRFEKEIAAGRVSVVPGIDRVPKPRTADTIVFANEFFDALPVEVIAYEGSLRIDVDSEERFFETFVPPSIEEMQFLDQFAVRPGPAERVEATLAAWKAMQSVAELVPRGVIVIVDYGYTREELRLGRHRDTVRSFRLHTMSDAPYDAPGEQDITAHVNFTALREAASVAGIDDSPLITQSQFLMGIGESTQFSDAFEDAQLPQERAKIALQLKHLVTPAGMGESFQVLLLRRGIEREKFENLSGLRFARM